MADGEQCPRCGKTLLVHGSFSNRARRSGFRRGESGLFALSLQFHDPVPELLEKYEALIKKFINPVKSLTNL